jgi:hypothetical protein
VAAAGFDRNPQEETMRIPMIVATAMVLAVGAGNASAAPATDTPLLVTATIQQTPPPQQPAGGQVKVDVNLDDDRNVWYADPLWIILGAAAVIVVVALIAAAARGGGSSTTVVR